MKTLLASLIVTAFAGPALAGPDFSVPSPHAKPLAASPSSKEIGPIDDVVFATNSTRLTDAAFEQLDTAARWLTAHRGQRVVLEGYADGVGMYVYNEDLATRRAFVVRQQLIANGIAPDRIILVTYGEATALGGENPLERRVVLYATKLKPAQIARESINKKDALSASWTQGKAIMTETKPRTVIGTR